MKLDLAPLATASDPFVAPTSESALTQVLSSETCSLDLKRVGSIPDEGRLTMVYCCVQSEGSALSFKSNFAGGTLGGISSGADIYFRVAVKPVSTIGQAQHTAAYDGSNVVLEAKGRHDPCVLPRTPPLVESMASLVLADAAMLQRTRLGGGTTTACDGSTNFVPPERTNGDGPSSKKPRTA